MKIGGEISGFNVSSRGLSIQRKKMNLIAENIANADTVEAANGKPYKRQFLQVVNKSNGFANRLNVEGANMKLNVTNKNHITTAEAFPGNSETNAASNINYNVKEDTKQGDVVFMPNHPNADENGYVELSNVNVVTEMVEMISASRSYEANLTAFNTSKQMAKDALEI